jgi:hypothetical protein
MLQIVEEGQGGHPRADHEDADHKADDKAGIDAQQPRREEAPQRRRVLETLRHEKTAHSKEDEDAEQPEDALIAAHHDERLVFLAAFGDQEGMREEDGNRRRQAQAVEILVSRHASTTRRRMPLFRLAADSR